MPPYQVEWLDEAKADVRHLDRTTAMRVFDGILHYARSGGGNIEPLHGDMTGAFRLRLGDYRVLFSLQADAHAHLRRPPPPRSLSLIKKRFLGAGLLKSAESWPLAAQHRPMAQVLGSFIA